MAKKEKYSKNDDESIEEAITEKIEIPQSNELLEAKDKEIEDLGNKLTRLQADFQNYKRRSDKEREQSISYGIETVVLGLVPIIDNFQRAIAACEDTGDQFFQGIAMIEKQFLELLNTNSVFEIAAIGDKFDPNQHHAVSVVDSELESGTVVEVLQKGYRLNEKVIRPAMVIVSK